MEKSIYLLCFLAAGSFIIYKLFLEKDQPLSESKYKPKTSVIKIICGDCCGEGNVTPVYTYLDSLGCCTGCAGKSYVLATEIALAKENKRRDRVAAYDAMTKAEKLNPQLNNSLLEWEKQGNADLYTRPS